MTHSFVLRKEEAPVCVTCDTVIIVKHILIEYTNLVEIRKRYFEEIYIFIFTFYNVIPEAIFDISLYSLFIMLFQTQFLTS